ncbi:MAG: non-ribosomal peptide synthetase [Caulobacteraceae bacterium]|nr:non-ribosomal peptide synthetase [Caulobacteraceae bacterium]
MAPVWSIARRIAERALAAPDSPALVVGGETWTYAELFAAARSLADQVPAAAEGEPAPVMAFMAHREASSYVAILACLLSGHTYVPLNVDHPHQRNLTVLRKSRAARIVCGERAAAALATMMAAAPDLAGRVEVLRCGDRKADYPAASGPIALPAAEAPGERRVYMLFTSGSTGEPKGVPITHANLTAYLDQAIPLVGPTAADRFSEVFELTFDVSVHDMFTCWTAGACLVVPTAEEIARPAEFIRRHGLTIWYSVPSLGYQMRLQGDLRPGALPSLRASFFAGEALPAALARDWAAAAPNSRMENWYGPTEATIVCARYRVPPEVIAALPDQAIVPIGYSFPQMRLSVHAEDGSVTPDGVAGELLLSGPQVSEGYLDDPEKTARAFVTLPGEQQVSYRTGDKVIREADGLIRYLGRIDNQVKVRGFRIELGEIEAALRAAARGANAVAMSWPPDEPSGRYLVAAIESASVDEAAIVAAAEQALPDYMVPARVLALPVFPTGPNGKVDRAAVAAQARDLLEVRREDDPPLSPGARQLMDAILSVSPAMEPARILKAPSLIAAGMDSLSFVGLTAELERIYGRVLSPEAVVELSMLSFGDMLKTLDPGAEAAGGGLLSRLAAKVRKALAPKGPRLSEAEILSHRTNRTLQFIQHLPGLLASTDGPLVLAIGSSGIFRGLWPADFEDEAARAGFPVTFINAGLPGLSAEGANRLCLYVREECRRAGRRLAAAIFELDPMHVSVLPPKADIELPEAFFTGEMTAYAEGELDAGFEWVASARGGWIYTRDPVSQKVRPKWERKRDLEVARAYAGDVEMLPAMIETWSEGIRILADVADRTICFIHPPDPAMIAELPPRHRGERYAAVEAAVAAIPGLELVPVAAYDLTGEDFSDINHVEPRLGRARMTRQLARAIYRAAPSKVMPK